MISLPSGPVSSPLRSIKASSEQGFLKKVCDPSSRFYSMKAKIQYKRHIGCRSNGALCVWQKLHNTHSDDISITRGVMDNQRVELIEANHVLASMQELGWEPGEKPPALASIQAQLRKMYLNGGHTNRLSRLREEAMMLAGTAIGNENEMTPAEAAEVAPLPEALEQRLAGWATGVGGFLTSLHSDLASHLATYRARADRDASERIEAAVKSATERIAAAEDEMDIALTAYSDSADMISELSTALSESQSAAAAAAGKTEAVSDELTAVRSQLAAAEAAIDAARDVAATAVGKADAIERELVARTARVTELDAALTAARTALATATEKLDAAVGELAARDERLSSFNERIESLSAAAAKANGRAEAVEHELDTRTITLAETEKSLITAMAVSAAAASRAEVLEAETSRLRERIRLLEDKRQVSTPVKKGTGARQAGPVGKPEKQIEAGGEV